MSEYGHWVPPAWLCPSEQECADFWAAERRRNDALVDLWRRVDVDLRRHLAEELERK